MADSILYNKAQAFAVRIVKMHKYLLNVKKETRMSDQVYRSGTSVSANIAEAQYAQSRADFITKMTIALKEANETRNWLTIIYMSDLIEKKAYDSIYDDVNQIILMLIATLRTTKTNINGKC